MKICKECEVNKPLLQFSKDKNGYLGYKARCKLCISTKTNDFYKTKKGLILRIYNNQKATSKTRNHKPPTYSKQELKDWLYSQPLFHKLYDNWKRLDYQKDHVPSVDRKDDYIGYTMDNIQLMTWRENLDKNYKDIKSGKNNKKNKEVLQYDLDGNFIKEYHSINEASRRTGVDVSNISKCIKNKIKEAGGFKWQ